MMFILPRAWAHHSHFVDFLPNSRGEINATIDRVFWANPHIRWEVTSEDGEKWTLHVQPGASHARNEGLTRDMFEPGDKIYAAGEVGRNGRKMLYVQFMTDNEGKTYGAREGYAGAVSYAAGADFSTEDLEEYSVDREHIEPYAGSWRLLMQSTSPLTVLSNLEIMEFDGDYVAMSNGGLEPLHVDADGIKFTLKVSTGPGVPYELRLAGRANADGTLTGTYVSSGADGEFAWSAKRQGPEAGIDWATTPFRLEGTYGGLGSMPVFGTLIKRSFSMTAAAQKRFEQFHPDDQLAQRCQPMGPLQERTFGIHKFEFFQRDDGIVILNEEKTFRIWFEDHVPEGLQVEPTRMGFSVASWEDDHLRIETTDFRPGIIGLLGYPFSASARVVERIWLSEDGNIMRHTLELHDPDYYHFPIAKETWRHLREDPEYSIDACDPEPFYIDLYNEGQFDAYIDRSDIRP